MKTVSLWFLAAVLGAACTPGTKALPSYRVVIRVESDPGVPLAGARVTRDRTRLGETSADGATIASLRGRAGDTVALSVTCPEGHRSPPERLTVLLRQLDERARLPEFRVACPPLQRKLVIAVRASDVPDLPLRYLGQEIARTDASGSAHALLMAAAGEVITLSLDTSGPANSGLMPQHPELKLTVPDRDDLIVFDQPFRRPKPKPKPRKRPEPEGPQPI